MDSLMLLWVSVTVFLLYVFSIVWNYGILKSISHSYYVLPGRNKWFFTLFQIGISLPIMFCAGLPLMFFAGSFIIFCGIASHTRSSKLTHDIHVVGAFGGILLGMASMWIDFGFWWIPVIFIAFTLPAAMFNMRNHTWWIEIVAYLLIIIGLFINCINC